MFSSENTVSNSVHGLHMSGVKKFPNYICASLIFLPMSDTEHSLSPQPLSGQATETKAKGTKHSLRYKRKHIF